ncbi:MAG: universal stress protein [Ignavibacteriaceae bacterium]|nr:universal stress protein [Ignavibacteriaceae bacterium]
MVQAKNILVPIDFSTSSYQVFELGHCLARHNGAQLHLIHVIDPIYYQEQQHRKSDLEFIHKIRFENAKEELRKFKFEVPHSEVEIKEVLIEGIPHKEILNYARQNDIDMIVIASHGWTNLSHMLMGNIADKIMRQADVPVICVKSNVSTIRSREMRRHSFAENWVG